MSAPLTGEGLAAKVVQLGEYVDRLRKEYAMSLLQLRTCALVEGGDAGFVARMVDGQTDPHVVELVRLQLQRAEKENLGEGDYLGQCDFCRRPAPYVMERDMVTSKDGSVTWTAFRRCAWGCPP